MVTELNPRGRRNRGRLNSTQIILGDHLLLFQAVKAQTLGTGGVDLKKPKSLYQTKETKI